MNKFNFKKEIQEIEKYLKEEYQSGIESFITIMFEETLTLQELKTIKINDKKFRNFNLEKKDNTILLNLKNGIIEINYALKDSNKVKKINEEEYELTPIEEDTLLDVCYVIQNKTIRYSSEKKEMHLFNENNKAIYSPTLENWTFTKKIKDNFYDKYIFINHPIPQFHFIKENSDKSIYKAIYISQHDHFGLEYFKNKEHQLGKPIKDTFLCKNGLIKKI